MIVYHMAELVRVTVGNLPPFLTYPIAGAIGDMIYYSSPQKRRNIAQNIANIMDAEASAPEVKRAARHCLRNYSKFILDAIRYSYPRGVPINDIELVGTENIDNVLSEGKGVIIASLHMGNLDLGVRSLGCLKYPTSAIVDTLGSKGLDKWVQKQRANAGVTLFTPGNGRGQMADVLRRNELLALMIDGPCRRGVVVKVGRKNIVVHAGAAALALRTGAPIVPGIIVRTANTKFKLMFCKPIRFQPSGIITSDVQELSQLIVSALIELARPYPEQWFVFHSMTKDDCFTTPELTEEYKVQNPAYQSTK